MPDPTLAEVMDAIADQLQTRLDPGIETLQVIPRFTFNPTPPTIDIYPSDPFQEQISFGDRQVEVFFDVRARVSMAEHEGGQVLLLSMMDPRSSTSVVGAISYDRTLGGKAQDAQAEPPSNFGQYIDPGPNSPDLLGCTWRTRVIL